MPQLLKTLTLFLFISISSSCLSQEFIYTSNDQGDIHLVNLSNCSATAVSYTGLSLYDIAFNPIDQQLYAINAQGLYKVDPQTGTTVLIGQHFSSIFLNSLAFSSDGLLYAMGGPNIYIIDPNTGMSSLYANVGNLSSSGGDLCFYEGEMYYSSSDYELIKINSNYAPNSTVLGQLIPGEQIFGLATTSCPHKLFASIGDNDLYYLPPSNLTQPILICPNIVPGVITGTAPVEHSEIYEVDLGNDTVFCQNSPYSLTANVVGQNFQWHDGSTDSTFLIDQSGVYWIEVSEGSCSHRDSIVVEAQQFPNPDLGPDINACSGDIVQIDASMQYDNYLWNTLSNYHLITVNQTGDYWVNVTNTCGTASDTVNLTIHDYPVINLGADTSICAGNQLELNMYYPGANYLWWDGSTDSTNLVNQSGEFWGQITVNGCSSTDSINISSYTTLPVVELGEDSVLCEGQSLNLNANNQFSTYLWSDNSTNGQLSVSNSGIYWVAVTNGCGTVTDSIEVEYNVLPLLDLGADTMICEGDGLWLNAATNGAYYNWNNGDSNHQLWVENQGVYWIQRTIDNCTQTDSIVVSIQSFPNIVFPEDTTLCAKETLVLDAFTTGAEYLWSDQSIESFIEVVDSGNYAVEVNLNGCKSTVEVDVHFVDCDNAIELPNVFTPNNNGLNDLFKPIVNEGVMNYQLTIYNRWGQIVFTHPQALAYGWDGRNNEGEYYPEGTYFCLLNYTTINNKEHSITGNVLLIRND